MQRIRCPVENDDGTESAVIAALWEDASKGDVLASMPGHLAAKIGNDGAGGSATLSGLASLLSAVAALSRLRFVVEAIGVFVRVEEAYPRGTLYAVLDVRALDSKEGS